MPWRRRPDIRKLARKNDVKRLVGALSYRDFVTDRVGRMYDLGAAVRRDAALALASVVDTDGLDVGAALIRSLADSSGEVRRTAARALGTRRETRAAPALAEAALTWREPRYEMASAAAVESLVHLNGPDSAQALVTTALRRGGDPQRARVILARMVSNGGYETVRYATAAAALALAQSEGKELERAAEILVWLGADSVDPLLSLLQSSRDARLVSIRALGRLRDQRCSDTLVALLSDDDPELRGAAAAALGEISDPRTARSLLAATADSDYGVRKAAVDAIQKLGGPSAIPAFEGWSSPSGLD